MNSVGLEGKDTQPVLRDYCVPFLSPFYHVSASPKPKLREHFACLMAKVLYKKLCLHRLNQEPQFLREFEAIRSNDKKIQNCSRFYRKNHPFIDEYGAMRIRGRLQNAELSYGERHPIILPMDKLAESTLRDIHANKLLDAGPQHMIARLHRKFWPLFGNRHAKKVYRSCLICVRN
uniref:Integrase zinc-binding domain-containing protein n=1 Tax=Phlebotomus papatasi TaxID=29031 RepID=A0A1B0D7Z5_PHLPP